MGREAEDKLVNIFGEEHPRWQRGPLWWPESPMCLGSRGGTVAGVECARGLGRLGPPWLGDLGVTGLRCPHSGREAQDAGTGGSALC